MAKLSSLGSIRFHSLGGRTIAKVRKFVLGIIRRLSPDIIVLELCSNDLTKLPAQTVGSELETLVRYLHDEFNVKSIAVPSYSAALPSVYCVQFKSYQASFVS